MDNCQLDITELIELRKYHEYGKEVYRKIEALELVEQFGSIAKAARILGYFYTDQKMMGEQKPIVLKIINKPHKRSKNHIPELVERTDIIGFHRHQYNR